MRGGLGRSLPKLPSAGYTAAGRNASYCWRLEMRSNKPDRLQPQSAEGTMRSNVKGGNTHG